MPDCLDQGELDDWRAGRNAVYQPAALTVGARLVAPPATRFTSPLVLSRVHWVAAPSS
jgi:hypothetical protein